MHSESRRGWAVFLLALHWLLERLAFYGQIVVTQAVLTTSLGMHEAGANAVMLGNRSAHQFSQVLGGFLADGRFARYRFASAAAICASMGFGMVALANSGTLSEKETIPWLFFTGYTLAFMSLGALLPCRIALLGDLFVQQRRQERRNSVAQPDEQQVFSEETRTENVDELRERAIRITYQSTQIGALTAFMALPAVLQYGGYSMASGIVAFACAVATLLLVAGGPLYRQASATRALYSQFMRVVVAAKRQRLADDNTPLLAAATVNDTAETEYNSASSSISSRQVQHMTSLELFLEGARRDEQLQREQRELAEQAERNRLQARCLDVASEELDPEELLHAHAVLIAPDVPPVSALVDDAQAMARVLPLALATVFFFAVFVQQESTIMNWCDQHLRPVPVPFLGEDAKLVAWQVLGVGSAVFELAVAPVIEYLVRVSRRNGNRFYMTHRL
ncbi:MAG: hypothetical protein MHM6MM_008450, partial [Cercozoa sp. M6MM]